VPSGSSRHAPFAAAASAFVARFNGTLALALPQGQAAECGGRAARRCQSRLQLRVSLGRRLRPASHSRGISLARWKILFPDWSEVGPGKEFHRTFGRLAGCRWRDGRLFFPNCMDALVPIKKSEARCRPWLDSNQDIPCPVNTRSCLRSSNACCAWAGMRALADTRAIARGHGRVLAPWVRRFFGLRSFARDACEVNGMKCAKPGRLQRE